MHILRLLIAPALLLSLALVVGCGGSSEPELVSDGGITAEDLAEMEAYEKEMEQYEEEYEDY